MADVREPTLKTKFVTWERVNQVVTQLIYQSMLGMFQIQLFGHVLMETSMGPFAQKVVRLVMF